jgi:cell division protein FtsN
MKSNNVLTYLLYLLLAGLVIAAGYKACQIKKEKQVEKEKQEAELQKALRDMGYNSSDTTTTSTGSSYAAENTSAPTTTSKAPKTARSANSNGIEDEPAATTSTSRTTKTTSATTRNVPSSVTAKSGAALSPKEKIVTPLPKVTSQVKDPSAKSSKKAMAKTASRKLKYRVQAGSFTRMEGARERLEEVIKLGFPNAEIGKINNGKYAVVIVLRTNNKEEAIRVADKLEQRGVDAAVMENK